MFKVSVTTALPYGLFLWALAAFVAVYGFFWSILVESSRPRPNSKDQSKYVGENLTAGFGRLGLVFVLLFFVFPCVLLIGSRQSTPSNDWFAVISSLGAGLFLVFATGKLGDLIAKIWPPLDVILDVDNYLRVRPTSRNPKSRIFTRYRALLKFVSQQGYDRVLFVSHSQGTAITADFLRFLREYPDGEIAALGFGQKYEGLAPHKFPHLYLMTMGCPLRQLYGWRFPHLYQWSRHEGFSSGDPKSAAQDHHLIGGECSPDPLELGVRRWINAYSSGDYVGRHLWRDDNLGSPSENAACLYTPWNPTDPSTESRDAVGEDYRRRELCFGVGAHTHYFVDNGEQIARLIDEILR